MEAFVGTYQFLIPIWRKKLIFGIFRVVFCNNNSIIKPKSRQGNSCGLKSIPDPILILEKLFLSSIVASYRWTQKFYSTVHPFCSDFYFSGGINTFETNCKCLLLVDVVYQFPTFVSGGASSNKRQGTGT